MKTYQIFVEGRNLYTTAVAAYYVKAAGEFEACAEAARKFQKEFPPEYVVYCTMPGKYEPPRK